jgi:hypothetical protein
MLFCRWFSAHRSCSLIAIINKVNKIIKAISSISIWPLSERFSTGNLHSVQGCWLRRTAGIHIFDETPDGPAMVVYAKCSSKLKPGFERYVGWEESRNWALCAVLSDAPEERGFAGRFSSFQKRKKKGNLRR